MSDSAAPFIRHTKTFKKYKDEFEPRVVDHVREWAKTEELLAFHEDNSIVKVTGAKEQIDGLLETLKSRFDYTPPEDAEDGEDGDVSD
ncbi:MAG: hypothetical protein HRU14_02810 [Planctomycetes bacterium]|nr:hypothetical protein [Planctomycetota bacterium]